MLSAAPQMCWFRTVNSSLTLLDLSEVFACWKIKPASYVPSSDHSAFRFIFFFHSSEEKLKGTILKVRKEQCCKLFSDRSIIFSHVMTVGERSGAFPLPVSRFSYFSHHLCMAESDFTNYCHIFLSSEYKWDEWQKARLSLQLRWGMKCWKEKDISKLSAWKGVISGLPTFEFS